MGTSAPGNKRLYTISEIACPDSCNQPEAERGCHFRMGPDRFTCTKCQLRVWRHFLGYELTPTDLQEMLHGEKITSTEKTLNWKKDGQETTIRGRLVFNEEYKVRIAPKLKSKQPTDEVCPKCKTGKLQLITAIDDSKWYGCSAFPLCRFTKPFVPHTFNALLKKGDKKEEDSKKRNQSSGRNCERRSGRTQSTTLESQRFAPRENRPSDEGTSNSSASDNSTVVAPSDTVSRVATNEHLNIAAQTISVPRGAIADATNQSETSDHDRYRRIPKFILRMLKLDRGPAIKSSDAPFLK